MPIGSRRSMLGAALGATALAAVARPGRVLAQPSWPSRPIRFVVGFAPGGLTDLLARAYGEYIGQHVGQPVVTENRAGAASIIAGEHVAKSAPDGHTFWFTISTAIVQSQVLYRKLPYDPNKDFTFVTAIPSGPLPLAVHRDVPADGCAAFVEFAKANPVNLGSFAAGSIPHMIAAQMNKLYGTRLQVVHFKGEAPMWQELAAGRIHAALGSYSAIAPHLPGGAIRPIAVTTTSRSPRLPDVRTFTEQGFDAPVFKLRGYIAMLGPAGLRTEIVDRLATLIAEAANTPRVQQIHDTFGIPDKPTTPAGFTQLFREEGPIWIAIARELGVTLD